MVASSGLPGRPDRRPRLHRPRRDDLRQLAPGRAARSASACSATPTRCSLRAGGGSVHALLLAGRDRAARPTRVLPAAAGARARAGASSSVVRRRAASLVWFLATDEVPARLHPMTPYVTTLLVLAFAVATAAHARGRRADLPQGRGRVDVRSRRSRLGDPWPRLRRGRPSRRCAHAYAPYSHFPVGRRRPRRRRPGRRRAATSRTRRTASALCAECGLVSQLHVDRRRPADPLRVRQRRRRGDHAVRPLPPAAVRERRPGAAAADRLGRAPMDEVLPDAFGPDDLDLT